MGTKKPHCAECQYCKYDMMYGFHCILYPTKDVDTVINDFKKISCKRFKEMELK